jgi:hypothetical protein
MTPEAIAQELTRLYRTPTGTMSLRLLQGLVLLAAMPDTDKDIGGVWTNASVGLGKTLLCALLMNIIGGDRPLIITEAANIPQMKADFERYRMHWHMPTYYRLESYETVSNRKGFLDEYKPTSVILDESQRVKPVKFSGRAKCMDRWRTQNPRVPMACLSGSPGEDFPDYAHTLVWAVPSLSSANGGPIPVSQEGRPEGPAFKQLCERLRDDEAFHDQWWARLRAWPGVVISDETYTGTPLHIEHEILDTPPEMLEHWERLRGDGEAPDGWVLDTGVGEQYQLARMLACGMYYEHVPRPPLSYRDPRKAWFAMCRDVIEFGEAMNGGPYDTPGQVQQGVLAGLLPRAPYEAWMAVKDTYRPITRTTWLSRATLEYAKQWGLQHAAGCGRTQGGAIIWTGHIGVGEELSRMTGWPYFGSGARYGRRHISTICRPCPRGEKIDPVIICSESSCSTGKNLQHRYHHNLFLNPPSNCKAAEQRIGRTHRSEQYADMVQVTMLYGCLEDWCAYMKAEYAAKNGQDDLTAPRKLLLAAHRRASFPDVETAGPAWKRVSRVEVEL